MKELNLTKYCVRTKDSLRCPLAPFFTPFVIFVALKKRHPTVVTLQISNNSPIEAVATVKLSYQIGLV